MPYNEYCRTQVGVGTGPTYIAAEGDSYIGVDTGIARTIKLPSRPIPGMTLTICDEPGGAATANITVDSGVSGLKIDGAQTHVINTAYGSITVLYTGTIWKTV